MRVNFTKVLSILFVILDFSNCIHIALQSPLLILYSSFKARILFKTLDS